MFFLGTCTGLMKAATTFKSDMAVAIMMILLMGIIFMIMSPIAVSIL